MDIARGHELLGVWFGSADLRAPIDAAATRRWFGPDPAFDEALRARFGDLVAPARAGELDGWRSSDAGTLALVLLLDQLPRNLFRGDAASFASDAHAVAVASDAITRGVDQRVSPTRRAFLYLPFEHAEDLGLQDRSVALFEALAADPDRSDGADADLAASYLDYARRHRAVIVRFGRFPHRNVMLGRATTGEEALFLAQGRPF